MPTKGSHAHSYFMSFVGTEFQESNVAAMPLMEIKHRLDPTFTDTNFYNRCIQHRIELGKHLNINVNGDHDGELVAFASYAIAFPDSFVALIDTYDLLKSGLINFMAVECALNDLGYLSR